MKTDQLFYELFKTDPRSLFRLTDIPFTGDYIFESITVKSTEKRMDGFFKSADGKSPNVFLEIQGYNDPNIYWRFIREICTWHELECDHSPFIAVLLFLDESYDPKNRHFDCVLPSRMIRCNLPDCLESVGGNAGALAVLKPLVFTDKKRLPEASAQWYSEITSLDVREEKIRFLAELLEYAILQRFPELTLQEIQKMIQLTPLEKTVAGQELISIGTERGMQKGQIIGEIRMGQRMLRLPVQPTEELEEKRIDELEKILAKIASRLRL